jgi:hypothetical protein
MSPSAIEDDMRKQFDSTPELHGTEEIAIRFSGVDSKSWILRMLRRLQDKGIITIIPSRGGRGHKTVYRRNRNSPGQPRKVR